jgi:hypothetical protein
MTSRTNGPAIGGTYPLGYFREDYEFIAHPSQPDYLDEHNGRFCVTPEYPNGTYAYFCTVDANWNSAYPYAVGPTYYGIRNAQKVTSITEPVTTYNGNPNAALNTNNSDFYAYGTPELGFIAIQINDLNKADLTVKLVGIDGKILKTEIIQAGSTISYLDTRSIYPGVYFIELSHKGSTITKKVAYF